MVSTFFKLPFVIKTFDCLFFEWPFYTGFTVPHLARDIIWESDKSTRKHHTQESQEVSPFPAGDHRAARNNLKREARFGLRYERVKCDCRQNKGYSRW